MSFANGPGSVGIQNFALDPLEDYIAAIDMDGMLKIHKLDITGARERSELPDELDIEVVKSEQVTGRDDGSASARRMSGERRSASSSSRRRRGKRRSASSSPRRATSSARSPAVSASPRPAASGSPAATGPDCSDAASEVVDCSRDAGPETMPSEASSVVVAAASSSAASSLAAASAAAAAASAAAVEAAKARHLWLERLALRELLEWGDDAAEADVARARLDAVHRRMVSSAEELEVVEVNSI